MSWKKKSTFVQKKHAKFSEFVPEHSMNGRKKGKLNVSEQEEDIAGSSRQMSSPTINQFEMSPKEKSATVASPQLPRKKIWLDKSNSSEKNTLTTKLSKILDQVSTRKERGLTPFWTKESKDISKKLWLPTKTDSVDSILKSSKESSNDSPMGESWFSIKRRLPPKKNLSKISSPLSQYSLQDSMDSEVTPSKENYKTLVMRIFPKKKERSDLKLQFEQFRWYWGAALQISDSHFDNVSEKKIYNSSFRDIIRKYEFVTEDVGNISFQEFIYDENKNSFPVPEWWNKPSDRVIRGAIQKFTSSLNSAISNYKAGNCKHFEMKFLSKKSPKEILHFEDTNFPAYIKRIQSRYWFTTPDRRRVHIPYSQIPAKGGVEVVHEKETERYFLHVPVERNWFPEEDRRREKQVMYVSEGSRVIALDPGVRKFLVGYDPDGKCYIIGEGAQKRLISLLKIVDKIEKPYLMWKKIKNLISELHWKVSSFLIENYDTILLPDFRTSQMVKRSKSLGKMTRRLLNMFSFYNSKRSYSTSVILTGKNS